jgi:hypothetical protein
MATWLFNSRGEPIAFIKEDKVFSASCDFIGRIDDGEVWHGRYKGEIYRESRLLYKKMKGAVIRSTPGIPGRPGKPGRPGNKSAISMPSGYRDVEFD